MPPENEPPVPPDLQAAERLGALACTNLTLGLLLQVALDCMSPKPRMVYNKSTREYEPDGSAERDNVNAIRALAEMDRILLGTAPEEESALRLVQVDFGGEEDYAR